MKGSSRQIRAVLAGEYLVQRDLIARRARLLALTLGVWGLLAGSFFPPAAWQAAQPPAPMRVYVVSSGKDGKIFFDNSPGDLGFDATGLPGVLDEAARKATN